MEIIEGVRSAISIPIPELKLAIGYNSCLDLVCSGTALLNMLTEPSGEFFEDLERIESLKDLEKLFSSFFKKGVAAERFFSNAEEFARLRGAAYKLEGAELAIGGNSAIMADWLGSSYSSLKILLGGPVGERLKERLPKNVSFVDVLDEDEVHLIMETREGERWGETLSGGSTRFITSNDVANGQMKGAEDFHEWIAREGKEFDAYLMSGFHMLSGQDEGYVKVF